MSAPHGWRIRYQMAAQNHPRKFGVFAGVLSGVLFGPFMALVSVLTQPGGSDPSVWQLVWVAVGGGVFFGACMGVFASLMNRSVLQASPLPSDTRPGQIRAARRLLRSGHPGQESQQNELTRVQAQRTLASPWWPKTFAAVFVLGGTLNAWVLLAVEPGGRQFWFSLFGVAVFAVIGLVGMPLAVRERRRAQEFLAATGPSAEADRAE